MTSLAEARARRAESASLGFTYEAGKVPRTPAEGREHRAAVLAHFARSQNLDATARAFRMHRDLVRNLRDAAVAAAFASAGFRYVTQPVFP